MVLTLCIEWFPEALVNASNSAEHLAQKLYSHVTQGGGNLQEYIIELVQSGLGIKDASDDEIKLIVDTPQLSVYYFADMYVSGEHLSSYSRMSQEELLLVPLKALSLFIFSWDICSRDMSREQQLLNPPRRSNC
jgi:hypothetical protein